MYKFVRNAVLTILLVTGASCALADELILNTKYSCPPCHHVKDIFSSEKFHTDGQCPVCGMNLIEHHPFDKGDVQSIHAGSGNFIFQRTNTDIAIPISVFYHKPKNYNSYSRVLFVVPGAARNAWDYRDSWIEFSEKFNVLVVSPFYPERDFDISAYQLGGVISGIEFRNHTVSKTDGRVNKYHLADEDLIRGEAVQPEVWLFGDFDKIFDQVVRLTGSKRRSYDIFGHSAGGQIVHRMAIFYPNSKADRMIAANSGSYTIPNFDQEYPLSLQGTRFENESFNKVFSRKLTVLVGEKDNDLEKRGSLLHTPMLNKRGLGRLSRGTFFYSESRRLAKSRGVDFEWDFCIVEDVGHDYRHMATAASKLLYSDQECITKMPI